MTTTTDTITITVDGKEVACRPGELVIEVAKRAGIYIPYFCYHPRMDPVGACRMCLVRMEPGPPKPQTACTTRVTDGMKIETQFTNPDIQKAQQGILELLLINHPLDCPICDRGGECPLQDQTQDYGPAESRFVEPKRRFPKPVPISALINLDRERCILCYRCTRFCEELSGDTLIGVMERGAKAYIYPFADEAFDSYFSGNTVQICPVGALTSTEYRFKARPWDVHNVASTCNLCASGCAIQVGVRVQDGNVVRFSAGTNEETNEEWLCDKGRYGNAYISSPDRLTHPFAKKDDGLEAVSWDEAFRILGDKLGPVVNGEGEAAVLVGESLCDEDTYVAQKLARVLLRTNNVDHRLAGGPSADAIPPPGLTYDDVLGSDLVVLVSLDAREELPILFLRLRIAATKRGLRTAMVHPREVALSEFAAGHLSPLPGTEAATGAAVAAALGVTLAAGGQALASGAGLTPADVEAFARVLREAERPVILLGPRAHSTETVRAWAGVAKALGARWGWAPRRAGTYGALGAGAHPDLLPGWRSVADEAARGEVAQAWGTDVPSGPGLDVGGILSRAAAGDLDALWIVGADPIDDIVDPNLGRRALSGARFVVVQDVQTSEMLGHADLVLPAATFVERDGTLTDWEGRRQPVRAAMDPPGAARADYAILAEAARRCGRSIGCRTLADAQAELDALLASGRPSDIADASVHAEAPRRQPDFPLRLLTYRLLYDDGARVRRTEGIRRVTREAVAEINPADADRAGIVDGQKVRVVSSNGSLDLTAQLTKGVREGVVFIPWSQLGVSTRELSVWGEPSPAVRVEAT
jgi:NADH-quinone oxidoreductase subunit G